MFSEKLTKLVIIKSDHPHTDRFYLWQYSLNNITLKKTI